jgi:hypothetical protein
MAPQVWAISSSRWGWPPIDLTAWRLPAVPGRPCAAETLLTHAVVGDGLAHWGAGPGDGPAAPYWCHGSAGIGTFLTGCTALPETTDTERWPLCRPMP